MEGRRTRIFLAGRLAVEAGGRLLDERALGTPQARLLWAFLVLERYRPATREELADLLWPGGLPGGWQAGLNALASKLRQTLARFPDAGGSGEDPAAPVRLEGGHGWYHLPLPAGVWVDVEQAALSVDVAASALDAGEAAKAWAEALVAATIARRPFLGEVEGAWVDGRRAVLRQVLVRALETFADASCRTDQAPLAVAAAEEVTALEPFRESAYRRLMAAHAASGNRAEALRAYEDCRRLLADELGTAPSAETRRLHEALLRD